jgi:hypothetical protein
MESMRRLRCRVDVPGAVVDERAERWIAMLPKHVVKCRQESVDEENLI